MTRQDARQSSRTSSTNKQSTNQTKQATNKQSSNQSSQQDRSVDKPLSRQAHKHERRQEEQLRRQQQRQRAARLRGILIGSIIAAVVIIAAFVAFAVINPRLHPSQNQNSAAQSQPTEAIFNSAYPPVDSIFCDQLEQTAVHYHALVYIYINGQQVQVPQGVGIASDSSCYYWMHTHDASGVIHMEAPSGRDFTLGNFFDIWSTKFTQLGYHNELSSAAGWTVYIGSQKYNGDFHNIVLKSHMIVTLAYNSPSVRPNTIFNWGTL
jgi:hypothetical protein